MELFVQLRGVCLLYFKRKIFQNSKNRHLVVAVVVVVVVVVFAETHMFENRVVVGSCQNPTPEVDYLNSNSILLLLFCRNQNVHNDRKCGWLFAAVPCYPKNKVFRGK